ncbi:MAG: hypothetical protein HQM09_19105 [Candidatus Riflebacteria bacterium]|nr:hypothetical protein [Candidatus Riflebacteria bacterium]
MRKISLALIICGAMAVVGCGEGEAPKAAPAATNKAGVDAAKALAGNPEALKAMEEKTKAAMKANPEAAKAIEAAAGNPEALKAMEAETKAAMASAGVPLPASGTK